MKCPCCGENNTSVTSHGKTMKYSYIRYRKCNSCGHKFKTVEYYQPDLPTNVAGRIIGNRKSVLPTEDSQV